MDSRSHVEFAKKLLPSDLQSAVPAALLPQIDRQPATLHRNYAHHLSKVAPIAGKGMAILFGQAEANTADYVERRVHEERERILAYTPDVQITESNKSNFALAARVAFASHLYLDTFNQPVQAFTPFKANCSGQFELWDRIGDFRYRLYVDGVVEELRKEWLRSSIWRNQFDLKEILEAMVRRMADLAQLDQQHPAVASAYTSLELGRLDRNERAYSWLQEMEHELAQLHIRYLG